MVLKGSNGNIVLKNTTDDIQTLIPVSSAEVSINATTRQVTINPTNDLLANKHYAVLMDAGTFIDRAGNAFAGITDPTVWHFTTGTVI